MSVWLLALAAAAALAIVAYVPPPRAHPAVAALAFLRGAAVALLAALALDAPWGRSAPVPPLVALDASASWTRGGDAGALRAAADSARALMSDTLWLAGDSLRAAGGAVTAAAATDLRSAAADASDRAAAAGRPLVLFTDGELDDPEVLARAPRGSRVSVVQPSRGSDAAILGLELPQAASASDTVVAEVTVGADVRGATAGTIRFLLGDAVAGEAALPTLGAYGEHRARVRVPLAGRAGTLVARAVVVSPGDREPRNDTAAVAIAVGEVPAVVFVSGAPDYDARGALSVARGALGLPVRAFYRVAPGAWRREESLAAVDEATVRAAARGAGVLVLHGDTTVLGPPRSLGRGSLALVAPPAEVAEDAAEWYATGAPPSPLAGPLSSAAWDSLPPLDVGTRVPTGAWTGLEARIGRRGAPRAVVTGTDAGRRVAVVGAGGFWRWQFRGGAAGEAYSALWGGIFDWLAAGRGDERAAVPDGGLLRAGDPVAWRRGGADSVVTLSLSRRGGAAPAAWPETLVVRFAGGARTATTPALSPGAYDVRGPGGASVLVVSASRELLPRRPTVRAGEVGTGAVADRAPRLRDVWWAWLLPVLLLCAEWLARRRLGLR